MCAGKPTVNGMNDKYDKGGSTGESVRLEDLPKRCFISHSYRDTAAKNKLLGILPGDVEPVIFPRLEPDLGQAVSDKIIPKILGCPGLIYLTGGFSSASFWVAFERDYALRSGRQVFSFDPASGSFQRDRSAPIELALTVMFHPSDEGRVRRLISWMAKERYFKIDESNLRSTFGGFTGDILGAMEQLLTNGGVVLWLMGVLTTKVASTFYSDQFVDFLLEPGSDTLYDMWQDYVARQRDEYGDEHRDYVEEDDPFSKRNFIKQLYPNVDQIFARIDPGLPADWSFIPFISRDALEFIAEGGTADLGPAYQMKDLYEGMPGDEFNWNRIDDLIIALYEVLSDERG